MCGIVGRVNAERSCRVEPDPLSRAVTLLHHRGPDGAGVYLEQNVGLGHRRLSVVDLSGGGQPMTNEDRSVWVTFNGEIYNHRLLREELQGEGHHFRTRSDTEVLVHGYEQWGDALPARLRGMFAFAVWDGGRRRLLLARDRLGIKPLLLARVGRDLLFASEAKALFAFADVARALEPAALPAYLALRYVPGPESLFAGIRKLQPGHLLTFEDGEVRVRRYWDLPVESARQADAETSPRDALEEAEALSHLLVESVRLRLMSDVPLGVFLSGGLDSTAVAWAMRQAQAGPLKSFSVGFETNGEEEDELLWARLAAQALGIEHREVVVTAETFRDRIEDLAWHLDEPLSDGACIPLMLLARRAREEVVVVLSGEGADELLGGYPIYPRQIAIEKARGLLGAALPPLLGVARLMTGHPKARRYLEQARRPLERRYFGVGRAFDDRWIAEQFGAAALAALAERFEPLWRSSQGCHELHRMLLADTAVWLPDDLLAKADRTTMAHAVELRVPFLDHELLEHAWALPARLKLVGTSGKVLLRLAMAGKVPRAILQRPKRGFPVPLSRWLRGALYGPCREDLLGSGSLAAGLLGTRAVGRLLEEHRSGSVDRGEELYALWVLEHWHRVYFRGGMRARLQAHGMAA